MNYTGKIISLAYPDTFVKHSEEFSTKVLLAFGLGKHNYIKAGHAAFVLIENKTGNAEYYDFGRYITPIGKGRVRSAITDVELEIPFRAVFNSKLEIINIEQFLIWLEAHPEKTHGSGRLLASICDHIYYKKAKDFILEVQNKGNIPYKAFGKDGCNCSRIVTETILASTDNKKIIKPLLRNKKFTPSPLGNVRIASLNNPIYQIENGKINVYSGSVLRENLTNYFDKKIPVTVLENKLKAKNRLKDAHFLSGTGSSAYFKLLNLKEGDLYEIVRYTENGDEDFRGFFKTDEKIFDLTKEYNFTYDSNCKHCHIIQSGKIIRFDLVEKLLV